MANAPRWRYVGTFHPPGSTDVLEVLVNDTSVLLLGGAEPRRVAVPFGANPRDVAIGLLATRTERNAPFVRRASEARLLEEFAEFV